MRSFLFVGIKKFKEVKTMADDQNTRAKKSTSVNPAAAGIAGAVVGAAVGAAAVALSDKKTRDKVTKKLDELKEQAGEQLTGLQETLDKFRDDAAKKISAPSKNLPSSKAGAKPKSAKKS
jgi:gas vesicle protein